MAYCAESDITKQITSAQLLQLTDDDDNGVADTGIVAEAIASADAVIDGYCAGRYTVPFVTTPAIIEAISVDLSIFNLYSRRVGTLPELRQKRYDNAMKLLRDIEAGRVQLGVPAPAENTERTADWQADERLFTRTTLGDF